MKKRITKKANTGITLIALVITIVVLIILAGVIISITLGNGGIIDRAKTAKQEYLNAQNDEEDRIAKYSNEIDSYVDGNRDTEISDEVKRLIDEKLGNLIYVTEFSHTATTWYKKYSNGMVEQGGSFTITNGTSSATGGQIEFKYPIAFENDTLSVVLTSSVGSSGW